MSDLLAQYQNGNLMTSLYSDGTRIRVTQDDEFNPAFAENVDVHISDRCDHLCPMCYAGCTPDGEFANLFDWKFLDSLHAGMEMALNLNFPIHPYIEQFLILLKEKGIVANVTVNQDHFEQNQRVIKRLYDQGLIYGIGVSLVKATPQFIDVAKTYPNLIIHVINGVVTPMDLDLLKDHDLKLLILGYKDIGRGTTYQAKHKQTVEMNQASLYYSLEVLIKHFKVVSFDNLALEQLNVRRLLTDEEWEQFYGGDDGLFSFYINLVKGYFAKNSLSDVHWPIKVLTMDQMFEVVRKEV